MNSGGFVIQYIEQVDMPMSMTKVEFRYLAQQNFILMYNHFTDTTVAQTGAIELRQKAL